MPTVLTVAGFDPSSGAGITADLAVFAAHGLFGTSAITALTVQSTVGVRATEPVRATLLRETLDALEDDLPADGIKIGMLGTADCVAAVADFLDTLRSRGRQPVIVLDPVLRASSGRLLLDAVGLKQMQQRLLRLVDWATPNLDELAALNDSSLLQSPARDDIRLAGRKLQGRYPGLGLVLTGGHMDPPDDLCLLPSLTERGPTEFWLAGQRVQTASTHGTGCAFSSAFLACLVKGQDAARAARTAKDYVAEAMLRAVPRGRGRGPMNLLWPLLGDGKREQ